ncbi:hypothetical protein VPNG_07879 [Cytospora leucostoma]|uniref:Kinetochore protein fta7 n=1 Tax=Cytospora leucostoma TaxID=1230097 RepID=A0A423WGY0_9PEZI|nr:hypothetical protein VPNG_07879 [Cytospora leucostoma]
MPPKAPDQKRKRGRPPGASRVEHDASRSEAPIANDEPDAEEQARPRKRGRKTGADNVSTVAGAAAQDGPAQPARRGRPPKTSPQDAASNTKALSERQGKGTRRNQEETTNKSTKITVGKKEKQQSHDARAEEKKQSSGPRRSGRERRPLNSDEAVGSNRQTSPKRRLPQNESNGAAPVATGATQDKVEAGKSKRKRNGKAVQGNESRAEDGSSSPKPRRSARERRARDPNQGSNGGRPDDGSEAQSTSPAEDAKPKQKRAGASPKDGATSNAQQRGHGAETGNTQPKRGRPRVGIEDGEEGRALQPQQGNRSKAPGKASKGAKDSVATGPEEEGSQLKRRGRPKASADQSQASEKDQPSEARLPVRGRPAKSREDQDEARPKPKRQQPQPKRVEPVPEDSESPEPEEEPELPFRHLREATRNISRHTISEKWNALDGPSINAVGAFLADAQRPVLLRLQDTGRRREHASSALSTVSRRLRSKLVKGFPFPAPTAGAPNRAGQGSYEDEFDFERIVDAIQTLESTLNPLQHSVGLLEREIKREEDALAKDYDNVHKLEANARSEAKGWREKARREHVLAPGIKKKGEDGDDEVPRDNLELVPRAKDDASGGLFKGLQDEELIAISKQLGSHMESMKGNLQQIGGVVPAITRTKAALQQVLLKHLDDEQYERVLVG